MSPVTLARYERTLQNHIIPALGDKRVRDITRSDLKLFLALKRHPGTNLQGLKGEERQAKGALAKNTVKQMRSLLGSVLAEAVDLEVVASNVAVGVSRQRRTKAARRAARARAGETVKAMTREQRNAFLATAAEVAPDLYPAFLLMALAGLRLGETLGLKWPSVKTAESKLDIHEQVVSDSTKTGESRLVDMADALVACLSALEARRRKEAFAKGTPMTWVVFPWLSERPDAKEQQTAEKRVRRAMERVLKAAGLPPHFTPQSLRHTSARCSSSRASPRSTSSSRPATPQSR